MNTVLLVLLAIPLILLLGLAITLLAWDLIIRIRGLRSGNDTYARDSSYVGTRVDVHAEGLDVSRLAAAIQEAAPQPSSGEILGRAALWVESLPETAEEVSTIRRTTYAVRLARHLLPNGSLSDSLTLSRAFSHMSETNLESVLSTLRISTDNVPDSVLFSQQLADEEEPVYEPTELVLTPEQQANARAQAEALGPIFDRMLEQAPKPRPIRSLWDRLVR